MAPLAHGVRGLRAGFQHDRLEPTLQRVGGGGETDRAGAEDGDGLGLADRVGHRMLQSF